MQTFNFSRPSTDMLTTDIKIKNQPFHRTSGRKTEKAYDDIAPYFPLACEELLGNSLFYVKAVGVQSPQNNP